MTVELHVPGLKEMFVRQGWLSDPATMAYNRDRDLDGAEGYDPDTGCIVFPRENWRWWRQVWINNAPDFFIAYVRDVELDLFVGEACWYKDGDGYSVGLLIAAAHRGRGYCAPALKALADRAFQYEEIHALQCPVDREDVPAMKGFARAGFMPLMENDEQVLMALPREVWERQ